MIMSSKNVIEIENLVKKFGDFTAVDGISFEVKEGELFGFLGPERGGQDHYDKDAHHDDTEDFRESQGGGL